jgi:hypothetical protein
MSKERYVRAMVQVTQADLLIIQAFRLFRVPRLQQRRKQRNKHVSSCTSLLSDSEKPKALRRVGVNILCKHEDAMIQRRASAMHDARDVVTTFVALSGSMCFIRTLPNQHWLACAT